MWTAKDLDFEIRKARLQDPKNRQNSIQMTSLEPYRRNYKRYN